MLLAIECVLFCLLMFGICYFGTGSDEKNINSYRNYPDVLKEKLDEDPNLKDKIRRTRPVNVFVSNFITFSVLIFGFGLFIRTDKFLNNFIALLILGQVLNLFDLLVMDLLWFRNSKRVRFKDYQDPSLYKDPKEHINSFLKAVVMFTLIAVIDGAILMLF